MSSSWQQVPIVFHYLRPWAEKFGLRGLTVHFQPKPLETYATASELPELRAAYEAIAERGNAPAISRWCQSVAAETPAVEAREVIRGLLLLFERLAEHGVAPFTDTRVRYILPPALVLDWSLLPESLHEWLPWLKKFEDRLSEWELYQYVENADQEQLRELGELRALVDRDGDRLREWCEANSVTGNLAENEAFSAEWLLVLADFAGWDRDADGRLRCPS